MCVHVSFKNMTATLPSQLTLTNSLNVDDEDNFQATTIHAADYEINKMKLV